MRKRVLLFSSTWVGLVGIVLLTSPNAHSQGGVKNLMFVQPTTPGVAQTGNANITGTMKAGSFSGNGQNLTNVTASSLSLPFIGSAPTALPGACVEVTSTGTGGAIYARQGNTSGIPSSSFAILGKSLSGFGVWGISSSNYGVYANSSTNYALYARSESGEASILALNMGTNGPAIKATSGGADGVGIVTEAEGIGIEAHASATSGAAYGVKATVDSLNGTAVYAEALNSSAPSTIGVKGVSNGTGFSYGGYFETSGSNGRGVYAIATGTSGTTYGLRGQASSPTGFGVYAVGDSGSSGTKSFVIDHPDDPANKYLRHYCAEGPAPYNIYQGTVSTDAQGFAWVELPGYYESINKNGHIQLTASGSGDEFVMAMVVKTIANGRFRIRTNVPHSQVFWEVKAERNDAWVQAHPPVVEYEKSAAEKGKYQHPELYGQSPMTSIDMRLSKTAATSARTKK